ncbi:beta-glucosidase [Listeria kieliensis]
MKKFLKWLAVIFTALISVVIVAAAVLSLVFSNVIENTLPTYFKVKSEQPDQVKEKTKKEGRKLAKQIEEEGVVLLKNDANTLPLSKKNKKVNVFGWAASDWLGGGSGSGTVDKMKLGFLSALTRYGVSYNPDIIKMYHDFREERDANMLKSYDYESYRLYEPKWNDTNYYSKKMLEKAKKYSDTAIFVVGRIAGESSDAPKKQYKVTEKEGKMVTDESRTYLNLSKEEEGMLTYLGKTYKHVVVLVNSTNTMALGELETIPGIDAVMQVGATGEYSAEALPRLLYGDASPSGKTTDTYAYDLATNASYANSGLDGIGAYQNAKGLYPNDGKTVNGNTGRNDALYKQVSYLDYAEGIYLGYRFYETADVENYWQGVHNKHGDGYKGVVQYPFGFGLSYTKFEWEVESFTPQAPDRLTKNGKISAKVKVKNIGNRAGKDVVEMYFTPPYQAGEIEKASTNLAAFAKTKELQPGESQTVKLTFNVRDMASYDDRDLNKNHFKGYELDPGKYTVKIMKDAHMVSEAHHSVMTYDLARNIQYQTDPKTGQKVENQFVGTNLADGIAIDGTDTNEKIKYMTRADFKNTFPKTNSKQREISQKLKDANLYTKEMAENWRKDKGKAKKVIFGRDNGLQVYANNQITKLGLALGKNYEDKRWDQLLNQMSKDEMVNLVLHGYVHTEPVKSIGKPTRADMDGPSQVNSFNFGERGTGFPNATVLAQTWNEKLAHRMGQQAAKEANDIGVSGWYAPGANLHRSPLGGRNYEYYSEDGFLSGTFASNVIKGAKEGGLYTYLKHLALYEQESNRDSIYTWTTEQALRENYLKPYQLAIQNGATGVMTSYNRIGSVWAGGSEALLTNVLRKEWGFRGTVITDYSDHQKFMNMDQLLRAGGDLWMDGAPRNGTFKMETSSNEFDQALRKSTKHILYTWLNAGAENKAYNRTAQSPIKLATISGRFPYIQVIASLAILIVVFGWGLWIWKKIKKWRKNKGKN